MIEFSKTISLISNIFTIGASGIALFIFFFKREQISIALNLLLNYSTQLTLSEFKSKLDRLNHFNASDNEQKVEVINILHEIEGQIKGNSFLKDNLTEVMLVLRGFIKRPQSLTEPKKRSLVHELRENIRNLDMNAYNKITK